MWITVLLGLTPKRVYAMLQGDADLEDALREGNLEVGASGVESCRLQGRPQMVMFAIGRIAAHGEDALISAERI